MKNTILIILLSVFLINCQSNSSEKKEENNHSTHDHAAKEEVAPDTVKGSPHKMAMANIGSAHIHIEYNSPAVRKRVIWGGLVALGEIWVTGAHEATSIDFSEDVTINGKTIPKGKYAFFTIPNEKEWTIILNKNWEQHLADEYSEKDDILRFQLTPTPNDFTERLTYKVVPKDEETAMIEMTWEKLKIAFDVKK